MKTIYRVTILLLLSILAASCTLFEYEGIDRSSELNGLADFAKGLDVAVRTVIPDIDTTSSARTVNPDSDTSYELTSGEAPITISGTPEEFYTNHDQGNNGSNEIKIPQTGYLENFYGNDSLIAQFSMKPWQEDDSYYQIKLTIEDTADFLLDFVYEKYLVLKTDPYWTNYDDSDPHAIGFIDYYDKMHDGSKVQHNYYEFPDWSVSPLKVYDLSAGAITDNLADYEYSFDIDSANPITGISQSTYSPTVIGNFFSYKESTGNYQITSRKGDRTKFSSKTFYAEKNNRLDRRTVEYSFTGVDNGKKNVARTVTRKQETYSDLNTLFLININRLTAFFAKKDTDTPYQNTTEEITQTQNSGITELYYVEEKYFAGSTINGSPDERTVMSLTQDAKGDTGYSGTMDVFEGTLNSTNYTVEYNGTSFKIKKAKKPRALTDEISLDLNNFGATPFTINLEYGGTFTGVYFNGKLTGTYTNRVGEAIPIDIVGGTIFLDGEIWN